MTQVPSGLVPLFFRSLGCRFHYVYISLYHISLYYIILFYIAGTSKLVSSLSCIVIEIPYIYIHGVHSYGRMNTYLSHPIDGVAVVEGIRPRKT